jgi:hypothetical protein
MKRIAALLLVLIMVLMLAACGKEPAMQESSEPSQSENQPEITPESLPESQSEAAPEEGYTMAQFLAAYGLTEEDITPENFIEFAPVETEGSAKPGEAGGAGYVVIRADSASTTGEQITAWFEKLCEKMKTLSKDGKLHKNALTMGTENDEEFSLQALVDGPIWGSYPGALWCYEDKNGTKVSVSTSYRSESGEYKMSFIVI